MSSGLYRKIKVGPGLEFKLLEEGDHPEEGDLGGKTRGRVNPRSSRF
jgi:hypothetical protein